DSIEGRGIVRMYASREAQDVAATAGDFARAPRRRDRLADADDSDGARLHRAVNDGVDVRLECRIGEMGMAIEKRDHTKRDRRGRSAAVRRSAAPRAGGARLGRRTWRT